MRCPEGTRAFALNGMIKLTLNNQPLPDEATLVAQGFAEWAPIEIGCAPVAGASAASLVVGGEDLGAPATSPFDPTWRWRWQPRGVAGSVRAEIAVVLPGGATERRGVTLRLQPRLLDQETWALLLGDMARLARSLAASLGGAAFANALLVPLHAAGRTRLEEALALLERHSQDLLAVAGAIAQRPEATLRPVQRRQPLDQARALNPASLAEPASDLDFAAADEVPAVRKAREALGGVLPRTTLGAAAEHSLDLPEHRWLVGLIELVERRLRSIRQLIEEALPRAADRQRAALQDLAARAERALGQLRWTRAAPPLAGLPARRTPPAQSQRLIRDQRYRPLRRIWRELRATPLLTLEAAQLALPIADLPALYEQWCALAVAEALLSGGASVTAQRLLAEDAARERWTLQLPTAAPLLEFAIGGARWRLRYQARYGAQPDALGLVALDQYTRIPDLVLERGNPDGPPSLCVLDAKYRRAPDGRAPQDALDDAYAYRGSIGAAGASLVDYAAILYPHAGPAEDFGPVGAIPLLPNHRQPLDEALRKMLKIEKSEVRSQKSENLEPEC